MKFFEDLLKEYSKITFPEQYTELSKVDKHISWYLADNTDQYITVGKSQNINILEIDIKQAFTSICRCLFDPTNDFIIQMNKIKDKKSRNIFIATSLVNTEYLRLLNIISKTIIIGTIFDISNNITLLELKKDGMLISCDDDIFNKLININEKTSKNNFLNFVLDHNFEFHIEQQEKYIRANRTSYFFINNVLSVRGIYKYAPDYIKQLQKDILQNNFDNFQEVLKIYSKRYLNILLSNNLNELLNEYYICDNKRYLADDGKYIIRPKDGNVDARNYLKTFIYPIVLSMKL
jgi:hypothetical protein